MVSPSCPLLCFFGLILQIHSPCQTLPILFFLQLCEALGLISSPSDEGWSAVPNSSLTLLTIFGGPCFRCFFLCWVQQARDWGRKGVWLRHWKKKTIWSEAQLPKISGIHNKKEEIRKPLSHIWGSGVVWKSLLPTVLNKTIIICWSKMLQHSRPIYPKLIHASKWFSYFFSPANTQSQNLILVSDILLCNREYQNNLERTAKVSYQCTTFPHQHLCYSPFYSWCWSS